MNDLATRTQGSNERLYRHDARSRSQPHAGATARRVFYRKRDPRVATSSFSSQNLGTRENRKKIPGTKQALRQDATSNQKTKRPA